jgi:hypothetical protein
MGEKTFDIVVSFFTEPFVNNQSSDMQNQGSRERIRTSLAWAGRLKVEVFTLNPKDCQLQSDLGMV